MTDGMKELPEAVTDAVAEALGDAYDCNRVWSAWGVGTMGPDDFTLIAEDSDRVNEIARAAIEADQAVRSKADDIQVLAITVAYEQGVGNGRQAFMSGVEVRNPYVPGLKCDVAWDYGYRQGKEQAQRVAMEAAAHR